MIEKTSTQHRLLHLPSSLETLKYWKSVAARMLVAIHIALYQHFQYLTWKLLEASLIKAKRLVRQSIDQKTKHNQPQ